jgi:hypothetical protein
VRWAPLPPYPDGHLPRYANNVRNLPLKRLREAVTCGLDRYPPTARAMTQYAGDVDRALRPNVAALTIKSGAIRPLRGPVEPVLPS